MKKFAWSLSYAVKGLYIAFRYERNLKIQLGLAIILSIIAIITGFSIKERIVFIFAILTMFAMEIMNSAVEKLADEVSMKHKREIGVIKDLAAAASSLVSLGVVAVWCFFMFK